MIRNRHGNDPVFQNQLSSFGIKFLTQATWKEERTYILDSLIGNINELSQLNLLPNETKKSCSYLPISFLTERNGGSEYILSFSFFVSIHLASVLIPCKPLIINVKNKCWRGWGKEQLYNSTLLEGM
jgi:hypothetical protein